MRKSVLALCALAATAAFGLASFQQAQAEPRTGVHVCGYQLDDGKRASKTFKLNATFIEGFDLNKVMHSNSFVELDTYMLVFWNSGEHTVFRMPSGQVGLYDDQATIVTDPNNTQWRFKLGWNKCR